MKNPQTHMWSVNDDPALDAHGNKMNLVMRNQKEGDQFKEIKKNLPLITG